VQWTAGFRFSPILSAIAPPPLTRVVSSRTMSLQIYDVIFWEADGEPDTIYTITAETPAQAVEMAERDRYDRLRRDTPGPRQHADAISLLGQSSLPCCEPQILHGPLMETGYTRGKTWLYEESSRIWALQEEHDERKPES
jgi:hypothetical protein